MQDFATKIPELEPDIAPDALMQTELLTPLEWILLAALAVLIAASAVWFILKRRKNAPIPPTHEEAALASVREAEADALSLRECSLRLSFILRSYLTGEISDPALYETHQEFNRRVDSLASIPAAVQESARELLECLASLKYAGETSEDRVRSQELCAMTRDLIMRIHAARQTAQPSSAHD